MSGNEGGAASDYLKGWENILDLEEIFRAHQREIFVYFLRTVHSRQLSEDLAQETFLRACGSALLFRGDSSVRTWLFAIARRVLADHFRSKPTGTLDQIQGDPTDPADNRLEVEDVLKRLPLESREAIVLCDVLGFTPSEAAQATGLTPNAFRVRLHRARRRFREAYGDEG
jgi:RNA polymerase sigma-70 factor (ECF subfamily)